MKKTIHPVARILLFFILAAFSLYARSQKPTGLMTDLLEHTDVVWQNGYPTQLKLWQTDQSLQPVQYAAIGSAMPAFSWIVPGNGQNIKQTAYRLILADRQDVIEKCEGNLWDSGIVAGDQSVAVVYAGLPLEPHQVYFWRVQTETNTEGMSDWSDVKSFRTAGTLQPYATAVYPQVKTAEFPLSVQPVASAEQVQLIDFGKDAFGRLQLTLRAADAVTDSVVVHLGECVENGRILRNPGESTIRYQRYVLKLMPGVQTYTLQIRPDVRNTGPAAIPMPDYIGQVVPFRYVELEGYGQPLQITQLMRESVHYPFQADAARFVCDNELLNQIWDLCNYSIKATSFAGIYVDGDRERIPYEADALINQLCHYSVDREYSMARRSWEYLLKSPTWPTEWILQGILMAWYDYLYTGDNRALQVAYTDLKPRLLLALREDNGLISTTTGLQTPEFLTSIRMNRSINDIVDWPHSNFGQTGGLMGESDHFVFTDYNAVTNAFHYEALKRMSEIAAALEFDDEAFFYQQEAAGFKQCFNQAFFREPDRCYADGLAVDTDHAALHSNMFPLAFALVPEHHQGDVMDFVRSRGMACSVYGSQFLLDAVYEAGDGAYGYELLTKTDDRSWANMLHAGSTITLEAWDNKYKPNQDWNHAWGAAPANLIPRRLMGIEPVTPGFASVSIRPQPGDLKFAEIEVPTIRGAIRMKMERHPKREIWTITLPANMTGDIFLPIPNFNTYKAICNGKPLETAQIQGKQWILVGKTGSGTYQYVIE